MTGLHCLDDIKSTLRMSHTLFGSELWNCNDDYQIMLKCTMYGNS